MEYTKDEIIEGFKKLREPFPDNLIGKLPRESKAQKNDRTTKKIFCKQCGQFHHPKAVHLDYVGHAAVTDRLLSVDPCYSWEPLATTEDGLPAMTARGELWIRLTVLGITKIGVGCLDSFKWSAAYRDYKTLTGTAREEIDQELFLTGEHRKELIGDAIRNAAMRFGVALDLWSKQDLQENIEPQDNTDIPNSDALYEVYKKSIPTQKTVDELTHFWKRHEDNIKKLSPQHQEELLDLARKTKDSLSGDGNTDDTDDVDYSVMFDRVKSEVEKASSTGSVDGVLAVWKKEIDKMKTSLQNELKQIATNRKYEVSNAK